MQILEAVVVDVAAPVVVGLIAFGILAAGLAFVRGVGKGRPHAK
ncbi:MAG TPA: hypothetical protein PLO15_09570 [Propionicimonas sp.]|nr:hypothetical protein [Propionicimonas sp.]